MIVRRAGPPHTIFTCAFVFQKEYCCAKLNVFKVRFVTASNKYRISVVYACLDYSQSPKNFPFQWQQPIQATFEGGGSSARY